MKKLYADIDSGEVSYYWRGRGMSAPVVGGVITVTDEQAAAILHMHSSWVHTSRPKKPKLVEAGVETEITDNG